MSSYASVLWLSNDPADWSDASLADGTSPVWPIERGSKLARDPSRQYSGNYLPYERGAVFRVNASLWSTFKRDFISPSLNVKSKAKAIARAIRQLTDLATQDERITCTVILPKALASQIRTGMKLPFKSTFMPGYTSFRWCRVLNVAPQPIAAGEKYNLALQLSKSTGAAPSPPPGAVGFLAEHHGDWPDGSGIITANLEARNGTGAWTEILTAATIKAAAGTVIALPGAPLHYAEWRIHMTVNWTTVFMPPTHFEYALLISDGNIDLFGNGWTPGGTNITGRTSVSTKTFVGDGTADGFSLHGKVAGATAGPQYGGPLVLDETGDWGVSQTDILVNTARILNYYWTWTV